MNASHVAGTDPAGRLPVVVRFGRTGAAVARGLIDSVTPTELRLRIRTELVVIPTAAIVAVTPEAPKC